MPHGFSQANATDVPDIASTAKTFTHDKTGARVLVLESADENKVFAIGFRTPPEDSTGIAHILEHSVLCGSEKFPVKEPFVELLKGSLKTFLNAFTFPDKTMYPVASTNEQDMMNLMEVYLDAVFFPNLTEWTLRQEGWHHELDEDGELSYRGVVFNEMKGACSSATRMLAEHTQWSLFPDNTYGLDSGGDPEVIPDLDFQTFMDFHRTYYHPANSYTVITGDGDTEARLKLLDSYFSRFEPLEVDSRIGDQPRFEAPARVTAPYSAEEDGGHMVTFNALFPETRDVDAQMAAMVLEHALIGMSSSPLRKALVDSGLGEDLAGIGLETDMRWMYFSTGLKGARPGKAGEIQDLIVRTLEDIVDQGLPGDVIEAALNTLEFDLREMNTGSFPKGLSLAIKALAVWLYEGDPVSALAFEAPLARLKERLEGGEKVLEGMIREHILDNPHRSLVELVPDPELAGRRQERERERLQRDREALGQDGLEKVKEIAAELERRQLAPDTPEGLASIPRLTLGDIDPENAPLPLERGDGLPETLTHELDTQAIVYADLAFDLSGLDPALAPMVGIFGRALLEMGTDKEDFVSLTRRIARKTGGVGASTLTGAHRHGGSKAYFMLRGKATVDKVPDLASIMSDVLTSADLGNRERFRQIVLESKARREQSLVPSGHAYVATRMAASLTPAGALDEAMGGVSNLFFLRDLAERIDQDWDGVQADLERLRTSLIRTSGMVVNCTSDEKGLAAFGRESGAVIGALPSGEAGPAHWKAMDLPQAEGLSIPAEVNYVGKGANIHALGHEFSGSDQVVTKFIRNDFLWEQVRVRGGAYGGMCSYDRLGGNLLFFSYRDPQVDGTLDIYDKAADYLENLDLSKDELEKSVIGAISDMDTHRLPDAKGYLSMARHILGEDDAWLQTLRDQVLSTTPDDFKRFARACRMVAEKGRVVAMGSKEALEDSSHGLEITKVM